MVAFSLARTFPRLRMCSESGQCSRSQCSRAHSQNTPSRKPVLPPVALLLITHHVLSLCIVNSTPHSCFVTQAEARSTHGASHRWIGDVVKSICSGSLR